MFSDAYILPIWIMKLFFDHICGKQADTDFIHTLISAP